MIKGVIAAVAGGLLGVAVWTAVSHFTGAEIGYVAVAVGALAGFGMRLGAGRRAGPVAGVIAAAIAIASVVGGKYAAAVLMVREFSEATSGLQVSDEAIAVDIGKKIALERMFDSREVVWPEGVTLESADERSDFPPDVWAEAEARLVSEEGQQMRAQRQEALDSEIAAVAPGSSSEAFADSFSAYDGLWIVLAVAAAFGLANAQAGSTEPEAEPERGA